MNTIDQTIKYLTLINPWWEDKNFRFGYIKRNKYLQRLQSYPTKLAKILIGARRVGKTSLMYTLIDHYLRSGISPRSIVLLNADLLEIQKFGIKKTIEILEQKKFFDLSKDEVYFLVDEVQELQNWQSEVKFFHDNTRIKFILSGSSASLLSEQTSKLTGRYEITKVLPLSFGEYLDFQTHTTDQKPNSKNLENYLLQGGYPERINKTFASYLQDIVDGTIYRDLLEKFRIRQPSILEDLLRLLCDKITTPVSINRIAKDLKIDDDTAKNYLKYLESVYLIYPLYRYAGSNRISRTHPSKYYLNDTGILNILSINTRIGHLAENAVFLEFLRRQFTVENPKLFYDVIDGQEYDFSDGRNLYEVKFDGEKDEDLTRYELSPRFGELLPRPTIIGTKSIMSKIYEEAVDVHKIDITSFLLGRS